MDEARRGKMVSAREERRGVLRAQAECQFVDPETFVSLVVAPRRLWRADDPVAGVRGVYDPLTGVRFLAEEERLRDCEVAAAPPRPRLVLETPRTRESR
jgi:hypothetical protein